MMRGLRIWWSLTIVILLCCDLSEGRHHLQKHPSAVVVGAVFCDTCFQDDMSKGSHYISGATVAVECAEDGKRPAFYQEVKTDKQGSFRVHLPFSVSKHVKEIQGCTVKIVKSSEPYCSVASTASSSSIHLKERQGSKHIYSAGFFTFKPLKQPGLCNQQPSVTKSNLNSLGDTLPNLPTLPVPQIPTLPLPEVPTLPLPGVPPLPITNPLTPTIPGPPLLPNLPLPPLPPLPPTAEKPVKDRTVSQEQFLFPPLVPPVISPPSSGLPFPNPFSPPALLPNPFQPPPSPLIPNPFQPPTPPSGLLPPLPNIPGIPGIPSIPGIPGIPGIPSPAAPVAPTIPGIPGIPSIPGIPGIPQPAAPAIPGIPGIPGIPSPAAPVAPTIPGIPGIPSIPGIPGIPQPAAPAIPGIPGIPGIPAVPGLTPPTPSPPASFLPPFLPPGFPGTPPAKLDKNNP